MLLYLSVAETSVGCVLGQHDESGKKERAIYYLSRRLVDYETGYSPLEKTCLALVWATQRLRHYMLAHPVLLIARMNPLKYLFEKPALTGRTARWLLLLSEFYIKYVTQKAKKGQAIADHLAEHPLPDYEPLKTHFPDSDILCLEEAEKPDERDDAWTMYFDGAANNKGSGVGASPDGAHVSVSKKLAFGSTNNVAEYEACIAGRGPGPRNPKA